MPKIKQMTPQQIAQYYSSAYNIGPETYAKALTDLIDNVSAELRTAEQGSESYEALNSLHGILNGLKNEAQNAGEARRNDDREARLTYERRAAEYAGQLSQAVSRVRNLDQGSKISLDGLHAEAQVKSAEEWIQDAQEDFNDPSADRRKQIARIIAARQIAKDRGSLSRTQITADYLDRYAENLLEEGYFVDFLNDYPDMYEPEDISKSSGSRIENKLQSWVRTKDVSDYREIEASLLGRYQFDTPEKQQAHFEKLPKDKTAAEYIEDIQRKIQFNNNKYTDRDIAVILAARQLANAKRNSGGNLNSTRITENELEERVSNLMYDPAFMKYLETRRQALRAKLNTQRIHELSHSESFDRFMQSQNLTDRAEAWRTYVRKYGNPVKIKDSELESFIDAGTLIKGHSGGLEDDFEEYLQTRDDLTELDAKIYGRYRVKFGIEKEPEPEKKVRGYQDYFNEHIGGKPADLKLAAKLAAANQLARKYPDSPLEEQKLNQTAEKFLEDPVFRFAMRDKEVFNAMIAGKVSEVANKTAEIKDTFTGIVNPVDKDGEAADFSTSRGFDRTYRKMNPVASQSELEKAKLSLFPGITKKAKEDFLKRVGQDAERLARNELRKVYEKDYKTQNGFDSDLEEDLELKFRYEELTEQSKKKLLQNAETEYNQYVDLEARKQATYSVAKKLKKSVREVEEDPLYAVDIQKAERIEKQKILNDHAKKGIGPGINEGSVDMTAQSRAITLLQQKQLAKRGPKYRNMIRAVGELKSSSIAADETNVIKTVNAILEYQDGKEKGFFSSAKNQRFNDSMTLLAELTVGTPAEKYYRAQLDKVNRARGLTPDHPNYLKPEDFLYKEPKAEPQITEELKKEQDEKAEKEERDLYDRIKGFSFTKDDEENEELNAENNVEEKKQEDGPGIDF